MKKYALNYILFFFLCALLSGCTGLGKQPVSITPVSNPGQAILVQLETVAGGSYSHPTIFNKEEMIRELSCIVLKQYQMGRWMKKSSWISKPLFIKPVLDDLAIQMAKAFSMSDTSQRIVFSVPGRGNTTTMGNISLKKNKLTWIFNEVDGVPFTGSDKFWMDNDDWRIEDSNELSIIEDKKNQKIKVIRDLNVDKLSMDQQAAEDRNWRNEYYSQEDTSEDSQIQLAPEPKPKVTKPPTLIDNTYKTVEQKLEVLQRWHQKGLISSEEYQKEKDKILKTFK